MPAGNETRDGLRRELRRVLRRDERDDEVVLAVREIKRPLPFPQVFLQLAHVGIPQHPRERLVHVPGVHQPEMRKHVLRNFEKSEMKRVDDFIDDVIAEQFEFLRAYGRNQRERMHALRPPMRHVNRDAAALPDAEHVRFGNAQRVEQLEHFSRRRLDGIILDLALGRARARQVRDDHAVRRADAHELPRNGVKRAPVAARAVHEQHGRAHGNAVAPVFPRGGKAAFRRVVNFLRFFRGGFGDGFFRRGGSNGGGGRFRRRRGNGHADRLERIFRVGDSDGSSRGQKLGNVNPVDAAVLVGIFGNSFSFGENFRGNVVRAFPNVFDEKFLDFDAFLIFPQLRRHRERVTHAVGSRDQGEKQKNHAPPHGQALPKIFLGNQFLRHRRKWVAEKLPAFRAGGKANFDERGGNARAVPAKKKEPASDDAFRFFFFRTEKKNLTSPRARRFRRRKRDFSRARAFP